MISQWKCCIGFDWLLWMIISGFKGKQLSIHQYETKADVIWLPDYIAHKNVVIKAAQDSSNGK